MLLRCILCYLFCASLAVPMPATEPEQLASELTTRYAPYADWQSVVDVDILAKQPASRYWRTPQEIVAQREAGDLPLYGLHLALDPGHIGGQWAAAEGRQFRVSEEDFYVREGELVLEIAQGVRAQLMALGAKVTLLREANVRVNPKSPVDYLEMATDQVSPPEEASLAALAGYGRAIQGRAVRLSIITGDLVERSRLVNQVIQPDALISLHINAAAWPAPAASESAPAASESESGSESEVPRLRLVEANNLHALIFGCMSNGELQSGRQQKQMAVKLTNQSGAAERRLGGALATALAEATQLPPATYQGSNAISLSTEEPYLFARNLLLLRMAECPTVLLEPYVANSVDAYARFQSALTNRAATQPLAKDDILLEYVNAVVAGVRACYGED